MSITDRRQDRAANTKFLTEIVVTGSSGSFSYDFINYYRPGTFNPVDTPGYVEPGGANPYDPLSPEQQIAKELEEVRVRAKDLSGDLTLRVLQRLFGLLSLGIYSTKSDAPTLEDVYEAYNDEIYEDTQNETDPESDAQPEDPYVPIELPEMEPIPDYGPEPAPSRKTTTLPTLEEVIVTAPRVTGGKLTNGVAFEIITPTAPDPYYWADFYNNPRHPRDNVWDPPLRASVPYPETPGRITLPDPDADPALDPGIAPQPQNPNPGQQPDYTDPLPEVQPPTKPETTPETPVEQPPTIRDTNKVEVPVTQRPGQEVTPGNEDVPDTVVELKPSQDPKDPRITVRVRKPRGKRKNENRRRKDKKPKEGRSYALYRAVMRLTTNTLGTATEAADFAEILTQNLSVASGTTLYWTRSGDPVTLTRRTVLGDLPVRLKAEALVKIADGTIPLESVGFNMDQFAIDFAVNQAMDRAIGKISSKHAEAVREMGRPTGLRANPIDF